VLWFSGDPHGARQLIDEGIRLGGELGHLPSTVNALAHKMLIDGSRNDPETVVADAEDLLNISQRHGMELYAAVSRIYLNWARGRLGGARRGADDLRDTIAAYTSQGNRIFLPSLLGFLAELEAAAGEAERALATIDEGLLANEGGQHIWNSFLHRLRGDILLKRDPADPARAEEAIRTAIVIAREQGARSYELLASLSLAKLYQSTARPVEARVVLVPALEGFSPTPEMPEIAEAQALLEHLARESEGAAPSKGRAI
jgi:predicted ATPase